MINSKEIIANKVIQEQYNVRNELQGWTVDKIRTHQPKKGFSVALLNVTGELNVGTIIRSAVIFGADKIYIFGKRKYDKRSVVGAHNYIDIEYHDIFSDKSFENISDIELDNFFYVIENDSYIPYCCEPEGVPIENSSFIVKPCFIFGNEGLGIPQEVVKECYTVSVTQHGVMRSLNVSVAAGIIMNGYVNG